MCCVPQLEFNALSDAAGDNAYADTAESAIRILLEASGRLEGKAAGLFPLYLNPHLNKFTTRKVSFGAMGDSFYEYLLKARWPSVCLGRCTLLGARLASPGLVASRRRKEDSEVVASDPGPGMAVRVLLPLRHPLRRCGCRERGCPPSANTASSGCVFSH